MICTTLYSISWLLHVSAVACHHQGASWIRLSYLKYRSKRWYIICSQLGSTTDGPTTLRHTGRVTTHYMIYHLFDLYFK
jgi:hypothetical protein